MEKGKINKIKFNLLNFLLFLYILTLSFLNYTIGYLLPMFLLCVVTLIFIIKKNRIVINSFIIYQLVFIVFCYTYVMFNITVSKKDTISSIMTMIQNIIVNIIILNCIYSSNVSKHEIIKRIEKIFKWFIIIAIFVSVFALFYSHGRGEGGRLCHGILKPFSKTETYTSTEIALVAFYGFSSIIYFFNKEKNIKYLLIIPLLILIIILSGSRKASIMLILLILLFYIDFNTEKKDITKKLCRTITTIILISIFTIAIVQIPFLYNNVGYRFTGLFEGTESSGNSRMVMLETAIDLIKKKPLLGYGLNTFKTFDGSFGTWAHNNYLELWVSGGIIGVILYYYYIFYLLIKLWKHRDNEKIYKLLSYYLIILIICDFIGVTYKSRMIQMFYLLSSILVLNINNKNVNINNEKKCRCG